VPETSAFERFVTLSTPDSSIFPVAGPFQYAGLNGYDAIPSPGGTKQGSGKSLTILETLAMQLDAAGQEPAKLLCLKCTKNLSSGRGER
jgi:hypothetical protein